MSKILGAILSFLVTVPALANQGPVVVRRIALHGWTELKGLEGQTMALNEQRTKAYWVACAPPTGELSIVTPLTFPTALKETEITQDADGRYMKKPGTYDRTVAYKFMSFIQCEIQRATSLTANDGKRTKLLIEKNQPLLGQIGLLGFEVKK
jgi:hypothetical protein